MCADRPILVAGLEHVIEKSARHYRLLASDSGIPVVLYTRDVSGLTGKAVTRHRLDWHEVPPGDRAGDVARFNRLLRLLRPRHVELYHSSQSDLVTLGYVAAATAARIPIVVWCRGMELTNWEEAARRRRFAVWTALRASRLVFYLEPRMEDRLRSLRIPRTKTVLVHNRMVVDPREPRDARERLHVLFLNSFKAFHGAATAFEVAIRLAGDYPATRFTLVGARTWQREKQVALDMRRRVEEGGFGDRLTVAGWTDSPREYYDTHGVFLFPSKTIFLNYALLEAMERGLVPVVTNVRDADRIVDHGRNGLLAPATVDGFERAVRHLMEDRDRTAAMAQAARQTVRDSFDAGQGIRDLIDLYKNAVWG